MANALKREDFNVRSDANGYEVSYKGQSIGGATVALPRRKSLTANQRTENIKMFKASAQRQIQEILDGHGGQYLNRLIEGIDQTSLQRTLLCVVDVQCIEGDNEGFHESYDFIVNLASAVEATSLSSLEKSEITRVVLDSFARNVPMEIPEDYAITVKLKTPSGDVELEETVFDAAPSAMNASVDFLGNSDVKEAILALERQAG